MDCVLLSCIFVGGSCGLCIVVYLCRGLMWTVYCCVVYLCRGFMWTVYCCHVFL